ncbi:toll/interleukin-1 receptor domain-containing protein [Desulfomicrobium salsuginis]
MKDILINLSRGKHLTTQLGEIILILDAERYRMQLLRQTLERVRSGESNFEPASESESDLQAFQKVANRLLEAKQQSLIHDARFLKASARGNMSFRAAVVLGGLTYQGEKFLESEPSIPQSTTKEVVTLDIFISHSTDDSELAAGFISLLRAALPIDPTRIRCTSVEGYRLPAGSSFNEQLRSEVFDATVLVALLSASSLNSTYTLFELGARWGAQKYLAPVLVRGTVVAALRQPLSSLNAIPAKSESDVSQLIDTIAERLNVQAFPHYSYAGDLRAFCEAGK